MTNFQIVLYVIFETLQRVSVLAKRFQLMILMI